MKRRLDRFPAQLSFFCLGLSILLFFIPNLLTLIVSFRDPSEPGIRCVFSLSAYRYVLGGAFWRILLRSLMMSMSTALLCLVLAYPFAFLLARQQTMKMGLVFLAMLPFWSHSLVRLYGIRTLLARAGLANAVLKMVGLGPYFLLYTPFSVVLGLSYLLFPFMFLPLYARMTQLDRELFEVARDLGATGRQMFWHILLPLTFSAILTGWVMVFFPALTLFYVSDLLGGGQSPVMGNLIKTECLTLQNWSAGSACSVLLILVMGALLYGRARLVHWLDSRFDTRWV